MSDLTAAVEALRKVFDSQEGSYLYTKGYLDESDFELMLATAAPLIEAAARADERTKTAEGIARAIETEYQRTDVMVIAGWGDGMADAAAIARQHTQETP